MIILHAGVLDREFLLWGEVPPSGTKKTLLYPFGADIHSLDSAIQRSISGMKLVQKRSRSVFLWIPSKHKTPIASSPLIAVPPESNEKITLQPWKVIAYPLFIEESIQLLCSCMGKQMLTTGVVLGSDLVYWTEGLRFAGSLVTRQQYLPGLRALDKEYHAQWEPVFKGEDTQRLSELAKRMPAVARSLAEKKTSLPPQTSSLPLLKQWITVMVDGVIRLRMDQSARTKQSVFYSLHNAWLNALRNRNSRIKGKPNELAEMMSQLEQWRRPIQVSSETPLRLCFRLEEPNQTEGQWYVRYLLQSHQDPSLLVPVESVWNNHGERIPLLQNTQWNLHEYLLFSLGQAAGLCPRITESLQVAQPGGYVLDSNGAHEFLTQKALILEQSGFVVMLPSWWTRKGTKTRLAVRGQVKSPTMQGGGSLSLEQMIQFNWSMALGGESLTLSELEELVRLKIPLVRLRGQWVQINAQEIQSAIEFWKKKQADRFTVKDLLQMSLGAKSPLSGFEFDGIQAEGWIGELLQQLEGKVSFEELSPPVNFSGLLRTYQIRGYSWLAFLRRWGLGACLADDMGLGKTVQTLALIQRDWEVQKKKRPVLLVCPTSVVSNWQKEAGRFTPELPIWVHHGLGRMKEKVFQQAVQKYALVVTSYGLLGRDLEFLHPISWAGVILDEAQNIKNPETKQARAARSLKADYRIVLTGTPIENNVGDLWSLMEFLNPGFLGTQSEFKQNFFIPIQAERDPSAAERLKRLSGPFILRRLKTDKTIISDLPEKMEMKVFCSLTKEQVSLYSAVLKDAESALESAEEDIQRKGVILATLSKLKQVCNHPTHFLGDNSTLPGRSGKLARLTEMLEEIHEVEERTLIFSQFSEMGGLLQRYLQETFGQEVIFLHGGVSRPKRDDMVERFQNEPNGPMMFILSLKAGGTGLNLTRANHVFHFDRWWNPAVENQATDRVFRIGQTRKVEVHKFICSGTMEEKIDEMIERKKEVTEKVIGTGEGWLTELSNEELKEIFSLREEAIGN